jgi:hypothetical protein
MLASTASAGNSTYDHAKHATTLQPASARRDLSKKGRPPPHRKIGFAEMARQIGAKWKALDDDRREHFESLAKVDKQRYLGEMEAWKAAGGDKASSDGSPSSPTKAVAASKSTRKSPASSPKSKKSRKNTKVGALSVPTLSSAQQDPTYVTPPPTLQVDEACEIAADDEMPALVSRDSSANNITQRLHDYTSAGANASISLSNYQNSDHHRQQQQQQQQQPYTYYHSDFHPPAFAARRVSEDSRIDGWTSDETSYSSHGSNQQHAYTSHRDPWKNQSVQPSYPYQQVTTTHRRREINYDNGRNVPISSFHHDAQASKTIQSQWNTATTDYSATDTLPQLAYRPDFPHDTRPIWQPTKTASSWSGGEATIHHSVQNFDDALDIFDKIDADDVKLWGTANPMA